MPITISRVVGLIEIDHKSMATSAGIRALVETEQPPVRPTALRQRAVPTIRLEANVKRLLLQLEEDLRKIKSRLA